MSVIRAASGENVWKIEKFLGLNENPDGDTKLKLGEASVCQNWRVTRDMNLQRRPGTRTKFDLGTNKPVAGMWFGNVNGKEVGLAASGGHLFLFYEEGYLEEVRDLGVLNTDKRVSFFPYDNIVYILDGNEYNSYDGLKFGRVTGYRPLIATSRTPDGSQSTLLEEVNKLNGLRRVWFSPDGTATEFQLPEKDVVSIDYVKYTATDDYMNPKLYARSHFPGIVTFRDPPEKGINTIEIAYTVATTYRSDVSKMTNAEIFLGARDNAVFLYGDGTNKSIYSGIDYWGKPRGDYFPDLNEMSVADDNTPITGMIRHYSQLICFKTNSAYAVQFGMITTATGDNEWAFYVTPINRRLGNEALGQVQLVLNSPITMHGSDMYQWVNNSRYSSNLSVDERQAKRISDRVHATFRNFVAADCYCYDDNDNQEYFVCYKNKALVLNYACDVWYCYTGLNISCMCNIYDDRLVGLADGRICLMSQSYTTDDGELIDSTWISGSISFQKEYMRKFMPQLWVTVKPEALYMVDVTVQTNKKSEYTEKTISGKTFSFADMDFANFSFLVNRKPQVSKLKIKAKKFTFLKLVLRSKYESATATVLAADLKVRETGYAK